MVGLRSVGVALVLGAVSLGGCEPGLAPPAPSGDVLDGRWLACLNDGAGDYSKSLSFFPDASFLIVTRTHATTDGTCGAETSLAREAWRYELGRETPAAVGADGAAVVANEITLYGSVVRYSIVYVDGVATPPKLYFGDLALDPARDGTAPDRRPDVLAASGALSARPE